MIDAKFIKTVNDIIVEDPRFDAEAYNFISNAVVYTSQKVKDEESNMQRHISGQELLEGIKDFAVEEYGPIAPEVLRHWGLTDSKSIGEVVFNMVNKNLLGSTNEDSIDDFIDSYDIDQKFSERFKPKKASKTDIPVIDA